MKKILISLFQERERVRRAREALQNAMDDTGLHSEIWAERVDGGEGVSIVEHIAARREEAEADYMKSIRRLLAIEAEAAPILDRVDALTAAVLHGRYFLNLKWAELEARNGRASGHLRRVQQKAFHTAEV